MKWAYENNDILKYIIKNKTEIFNFGLTGLTSFIFNYSIFYYLSQIIGMSANISATYAFWIAAIWHFSLNKVLTFRAKNQRLISNLIKYSLLLIINYGLTLLSLYIIVNFTKLNLTINVYISTISNALCSYFFMKYIVFKK
jgi:putative flippase GtrA